MKPTVIAVLLQTLATCTPAAFAKNPLSATYDIFYLSVGSSYYLMDASGDRFRNVPGANKSAKRISAALDAAGALAGISLTSEPGAYVTRDDVMEALRTVLQRVKESQAKHPLLIFYFCGHGISEGIGWNQFLVPGNYRPPRKETVDTLTESAIYLGEISDAVEAQNIACLLLVDACYTARNNTVSKSPIISSTLADNLNDSFKVLRALNEFRGPTMAVFSVEPGQREAQTVQDPIDTSSVLSVGPVARRLLLSVKRHVQNRETLTISQFLREMANPSFDELTQTVLTHSQPSDPDTLLPVLPVTKPTEGEARIGSSNDKADRSRTATSARPVRGARTPPPKSYQVLPDTSVHVTGESAEFVSDGKSYDFRTPSARFAPSERGTGEFKLSITSGDTEWDVIFIAPSGKVLERGEYLGAQRAHLQEGQAPGFEFSGDARACNEVDARFLIRQIERDQTGTILLLDAEFAQRCTSSAKSLSGIVHFRAKAAP